jgi:hypothetical protein
MIIFIIEVNGRFSKAIFNSQGIISYEKLIGGYVIFPTYGGYTMVIRCLIWWSSSVHSYKNPNGYI